VKLERETIMNLRTPRAESRIFYGWWVVAAAFAITFLGFGSAYTFSAFLEQLQRDFGASRGSVSLVFSLAGFLYFGLGIISGPLADRFGSRPFAVIGMVLLGVGLRLPARRGIWSRSMWLTASVSDLAAVAPMCP
jgi:OFA family oxalate/formate antiporter-like MFS transporter